MGSSTVVKLLGEELCRNNGDKVRTSQLCGDGRVIGLFFSGHWCAPCRAFTPDLTTFYQNFKASDKRDNLEVVFISSDEDEEHFKEYFSTMPWLAVPFDEKEKKIYLTRKLRVHNIPSLVLIDSTTGEIITERGRDHVVDDPQGLEFPWKPRDPITVFREVKLINNRGEKFDFDALNGQIKGIYFSAHWCPPCKAFTPHLVETYRKVRQAGHKFQIIFVSSDRSEESYQLYFASMPWLAIPYNEEKQRKELAVLYGVGGIPTLIILDENNLVITKDGRLEVNDDPDGEFFPWNPKAVDELTERYALKLNEDPCLVLFTEGDEKDLDSAYNVLKPVAEDFLLKKGASSGSDETILHFFYGGEAEICDTLRDLMHLEDQVPLLVIVDVQGGKRFVFEEDVEITTDVVRTFVNDYLSGKLEPTPLNT